LPEAAYEGESPEEYADFEDLRGRLSEVLDSLSPRERDVLILRYGLEDGIEKSLSDIGSEFSLTRERVRQIEAKGLRKLRHPNRNSDLNGFL
jgi:RNA polymerase primary sigma factor